MLFKQWAINPRNENSHRARGSYQGPCSSNALAVFAYVFIVHGGIYFCLDPDDPQAEQLFAMLGSSTQ